jgi:hypothetical protein
MIGITLTLTLPGFGGLLGDRKMREYPYPNLRPALDLPGHRDTGRLDLPGGYPRMFQRLQTVSAERYGTAALGSAGELGAMHFSMFNSLRL